MLIIIRMSQLLTYCYLYYIFPTTFPSHRFFIPLNLSVSSPLKPSSSSQFAVKRSKSTPANTTKFEIDSNLVTTSTISPKPGITVEGLF